MSKYISSLKPSPLPSQAKHTLKTQQNEELLFPVMNSSPNDHRKVQNTFFVPEKLNLKEYIHSIEAIKKDERHRQQQKANRHNGKVRKYKQMIKSVEAGNQMFEQFIDHVCRQTNTFRSTLTDRNGRTEEIKKTGKLAIIQDDAIRKSEEKPVQNRFDRFYEQLAEESSRKEDLQNLKKMLVTSSLNKNFENYLSERRLRMPEFIRKMQ